ncbi:MAG TPA: hypothetical protein VFI59_01640 [Actinomycetota bacterium]|nr:hypothetical protein [Actinomycetota bacterium]
MGFDELGEAIAEGALEGAASSIPPPPVPSGGSPMPPPPGTGGEGEGPPPPEEPEQPQRRATVPIVIALLATVLVGVGAFAVVSWASGDTGCGPGDFESVRFGYCARTPAGWIAAAARGEDSPLDRFLLQDGAATMTVTAVSLTKGQDLARFEQFVRGYDEDAGGRTGAASALEVDGVEAVAFDVIVEGVDGTVRSREVLFLRDGVAWRVTLADEEVGFEASLRRLDELLDSWHFV